MNKNKVAPDVYEELCKQVIIHQEVIEKVQGNFPNEDIMVNVSELFKVLGDRTRTRILYALSEAEMCVCDIAYLLGMTQSSISHQLRVLKQAKLVKNRKEGKVVYYSLADQHVIQIFDQAFQHVNESNA